MAVEGETVQKKEFHRAAWIHVQTKSKHKEGAHILGFDPQLAGCTAPFILQVLRQKHGQRLLVIEGRTVINKAHSWPLPHGTYAYIVEADPVDEACPKTSTSRTGQKNGTRKTAVTATPECTPVRFIRRQLRDTFEQAHLLTLLYRTIH